MTRFTWGLFHVAALFGVVTLFTACGTPPLGPDEVEVEHTRMGYSCKSNSQSDKIDANWSKLDAGMTVIEIDQLIGLPFPVLGTTASAINNSQAFEVDYCGLFLVFRNGQLTQKPLKPAKQWGSDYQQTWTTREKKSSITSTAVTVKGGSPLHVAAASGNLEAVRQLLANGANRNSQDDSGRMAIHAAACQGNAAVIRLLISEPDDVNTRSRGGSTPLHSAVDCRQFEAVQFLIAADANVNALTTPTTDNGLSVTPLYLAASSGRLDLVKLLIEHGADVNGAGGEVPIVCSVGRCAGVIYPLGPRQDAKIVALLLTKGADVNRVLKQDGRTALHTAAAWGKDEFVRLLLANKANVNARDSKGQSPLSLARKNKHGSTAQLLEQAGGVE